VEVLGGWKQLHNKDHHNFLSSSDIFRMKKSTSTRQACVTHDRNEICIQNSEREYMGDLAMDGRIILK
jgi:hypothetical protein